MSTWVRTVFKNLKEKQKKKGLKKCDQNDWVNLGMICPIKINQKLIVLQNLKKRSRFKMIEIFQHYEIVTGTDKNL